MRKTWDFFISHASEDKEEFVRPLVIALLEHGCSVWYDEFTLEPGTRLAESIDKGIAGSRFGLVVLSRAFFRKKWPRAELEALFAQEGPRRRRVVPILLGMTHQQVRSNSPLLGGLVALDASQGFEDIATRLHQLLRKATPASGSNSPHRLPPSINAPFDKWPISLFEWAIAGNVLQRHDDNIELSEEMWSSLREAAMELCAELDVKLIHSEAWAKFLMRAVIGALMTGNTLVTLKQATQLASRMSSTLPHFLLQRSMEASVFIGIGGVSHALAEEVWRGLHVYVAECLTSGALKGDSEYTAKHGTQMIFDCLLKSVEATIRVRAPHRMDDARLIRIMALIFLETSGHSARLHRMIRQFAS